MSRFRNVAVACATVLVTLVCVSVVPASAVSSSSVASSPLTEATAASSDARQLRRDVASSLGKYLTTYGDRFTSRETTKLEELKARADRQLGFVVLATNRLRWSIANRSSRAQIAAAGTAAQTTPKRARATAEASFDQARAIVEPKLSVIERIRALSDYNSMMDRFDALGDQLAAITKQYQ